MSSHEPSREDVLAARLRVLRNRPAGTPGQGRDTNVILPSSSLLGHLRDGAGGLVRDDIPKESPVTSEPPHPALAELDFGDDLEVSDSEDGADRAPVPAASQPAWQELNGQALSLLDRLRRLTTGRQVGYDWHEHVKGLGEDDSELDRRLSQTSSGEGESFRLSPSPLSDASVRDKSDRPPSPIAAAVKRELFLPTVPSRLAEPVAASTDSEDGHKPRESKRPQSLAAFERSMAARMAALRVTPGSSNGSGAGTVGETHTIDPFVGLPSAPSFRPEDRAAPSLPGAPSSLGGSTVRDEEAWCVVCLEDGTMRCAGCEGDVFCARCWRDMHVGPSAWQDARSHPWTKLKRKETPPSPRVWNSSHHLQRGSAA